MSREQKIYFDTHRSREHTNQSGNEDKLEKLMVRQEGAPDEEYFDEIEYIDKPKPKKPMNPTDGGRRRLRKYKRRGRKVSKRRRTHKRAGLYKTARGRYRKRRQFSRRKGGAFFLPFMLGSVASAIIPKLFGSGGVQSVLNARLRRASSRR